MALGAHPEASLRQGTEKAFDQKPAIARWAASVIQPGENILLDAGSTVGALAHELWGFEKLSVTTPGVNTMQELAYSEGIEVDCLGGRLCDIELVLVESAVVVGTSASKDQVQAFHFSVAAHAPGTVRRRMNANEPSYHLGGVSTMGAPTTSKTGKDTAV